MIKERFDVDIVRVQSAFGSLYFHLQHKQVFVSGAEAALRQPEEQRSSLTSWQHHRK
jgi:hypothetical protein